MEGCVDLNGESTSKNDHAQTDRSVQTTDNTATTATTSRAVKTPSLPILQLPLISIAPTDASSRERRRLTESAE